VVSPYRGVASGAVAGVVSPQFQNKIQCDKLNVDVVNETTSHDDEAEEHYFDGDGSGRSLKIGHHHHLLAQLYQVITHCFPSHFLSSFLITKQT
jgi:hypothetical protein